MRRLREKVGRLSQDLMKVRHAAALALVGWYFMMLPRDPRNPTYADTSAPMSLWAQLAALDTAAECEDHKLKFYDRLVKEEKKERADFSLDAACVESNDPRLAK
jgi:hypothetical protein